MFTFTAEIAVCARRVSHARGQGYSKVPGSLSWISLNYSFFCAAGECCLHPNRRLMMISRSSYVITRLYSGKSRVILGTRPACQIHKALWTCIKSVNHKLHHLHIETNSKMLSLKWFHEIWKGKRLLLPVIMSAHFRRNFSPFRCTAAVAASTKIGNLYSSWQNIIDLHTNWQKNLWARTS